jgi:TPR repeat protein
MPSWLQRFSLCAFTVLLCASFSAAADLASAKDAYQQKDYVTAFKELTPLAEKGNADAQFILGKMYWMGQGVLKDPEQAMKLFKASALQGNADAQFFLGSIYLLPHTDIAEGVKWLRLSAEQGNQDAQWMLGKAYLHGAKELPRDPVQAEMWLWLAAKDNLEFYEKGLLAAEKEMTPEQIANGKALATAWKPKHGLRPDQKPARDEKPGADRKPES